MINFYILVYQVEQGKDNEMKHLQGMLQLMQKKRVRAVKNILKSCTIHLEGIRDVKAAVVYVNKKDTRVGEHVTLGDFKIDKRYNKLWYAQSKESQY